MAQPTPKHDIQQFWKSLYDSLHGGEDSNASREGLRQGLEALEDMFRYRRHMAVVEMALAQLSGKAVLEVGSGAGSHSAMFALHGAHVTSVDLTLDRVRATAVKFALLQPSANGCIAVQGDAEGLPFGDNAFDIVYSNGVLHHTNDTEAALAEVYRVLKPGGKAVIMLYCKSSWHYWFNLLLCEGLLRGRLFGNSNWLGNVTEWGGKRPQTVENPITAVTAAAASSGSSAGFAPSRCGRANSTFISFRRSAGITAPIRSAATELIPADCWRTASRGRSSRPSSSGSGVRSGSPGSSAQRSHSKRQRLPASRCRARDSRRARRWRPCPSRARSLPNFRRYATSRENWAASEARCRSAARSRTHRRRRPRGGRPSASPSALIRR
ncbi:MAG: class I SAM-dependent methyltransferase [Rhodospirillales bacterium]|nr:class I SAM-dependent methyltransferase [Rhodospirillales bacterium]